MADSGDEIGAPGRERTGDSIRHIAKLLDGLHHLLARLFRHQGRIGQTPAKTVILETPASFETVAHGSFFDVTNAAAKGVRSTKACLPKFEPFQDKTYTKIS